MLTPEYAAKPENEIETLLEKGMNCFALADASEKNQNIREHILDDNTLQVFPLYFDTDFESLLDISPLLVALQPKHNFTHWFIETASQVNNGVGILLVSEQTTQKVVKHLQNLLQVIMPCYDLFTFRFYDPRVLQIYANGVEEGELRKFVGPLHQIWWPYIRTFDNKRYWFALSNNMSSTREEAFSLSEDDFPLEITKKMLETFEDMRLQELAMRITTLFPN